MADAFHNPLRGLLGYQLRRASAAAMDELAHDLAAVNLRITEASVLLLAGANPQLRSSEIGRELGVHRANMTPLVTALERRGLLVREPVDGRSQRLSLTFAGHAVRKRALQLMRAHDARLLQRISGTEARNLPGALEQLWSAAGEVSGVDIDDGPSCDATLCSSPDQTLSLAEK